ncbi:MAG: type II/IV secretion system protein [Candidatus Kerfeldbacteria bacterium]|nr:type II/IV secretion system protein [Candidatus Kerfeldbacteria bacterium]
MLQRIEDLLATAAAKDDTPTIKLREKMREIELDTLETITQQQAAELTLQYINLKGFPIGPEVLSLIPEDQARRMQTVAFFKVGGQIRLGTRLPDHPELPEIMAELQHQFPGSSIGLYLISEHSLSEALKLYKNVAKVKEIKSDVALTKEQLDRFQVQIKNFGDMEKQIPTVNLTEAFAMVVAMSLNVGSSDIHIEAEEKEVVIRYRVDGLLQIAARIPASIWPRLIARIKGIAGLKINIASIPQDGRITIKMQNDKMDIRVSTIPTAWGESVVMRLLKSSSVGLSFDQLGLRPSAYQRLKHEIEKPQGMIVTTGPTGSGKTTTLYAVLNTLNTPATKIITLENPIEYRLAGIAQSQIDHSKEYTFSKGLRAILRQDPNIVMVGEIRDLETAETAIQAALTGHLLLSTIHTNDAAGAIPRFLSMGVQPFLLAPAMNAIIGQRLVRKICPQCKTEATVELEMLERVKKLLQNIPENSGETIPDMATLKFYEGKGCSQCHTIGYKGRIGIYEVFTKNPEIEALILSGTVSEYQMKEITHRNGMLTMAQDGMLKALAGITSVAEVLRVAVID